MEILPSVLQLSMFLMHRFLSNFDCCFPWAIHVDVLGVIFYDYFSFSLTWNPIGIYIKMILLLQIADDIFQISPEFLPNGPHKTTFVIFKILKIEILMIFLALLDYVSRAHEIEICPSSVVSPSVRLCRNYL